MTKDEEGFVILSLFDTNLRPPPSFVVGRGGRGGGRNAPAKVEVEALLLLRKKPPLRKKKYRHRLQPLILTPKGIQALLRIRSWRKKISLPKTFKVPAVTEE